MAYNETYWLLAGTAAPVIALAAVLSISELQRLAGRLADQYDTDTREAPARGAAVDDFKFQTLVVKHARGLGRQATMANVVMLLQALNVFGQGTLLFTALSSIAIHKDELALPKATALAVVGLGLLFIAGLLNVQARNDDRIFRYKAARYETAAARQPGNSPGKAPAPPTGPAPAD